MTARPNILFVMADQLRWDYLGCAGHPHIKTPVIDALAARGVAFTRAFVQAPVCGGSRMSFYTGRYNASHGATYNNFPLRIDEKTIGDYLRPLGYRVALIGKTHMKADEEGTVPGYHCWAEFYLPDKGWVPVDASDASKSADPKKRDYLFGHLDPDRIQFSIGRDIRLAPPPCVSSNFCTAS